MGQVAAMGKIHAQYFVARFERSKVDCHIGLTSGMRLNIGIFSIKNLFATSTCQGFDLISIITAAIVAPVGVSFSVLVGKY